VTTPRRKSRMTDSTTIEPQGHHEYLVRLSGDGEIVESWFRVTPGLLDALGLDDVDEATVVRRTVEFLLGHQAVPDFPQVVEIEDVVAGYDDYLALMSV
jgi:hypothetical protein